MHDYTHNQTIYPTQGILYFTFTGSNAAGLYIIVQNWTVQQSVVVLYAH